MCVELPQYKNRWHFKDANWVAIRDAIEDFDCNLLQQHSVDSSVELFVKFLQDLMQAHIPQSVKEVRKATLPWLNDRCNHAIARKHAAEGSPAYILACSECSQVLFEEKQKHMQKLKTQMEELPRSSKRWWSIMKQLLNRQGSPSFFPPMKNNNGD